MNLFKALFGSSFFQQEMKRNQQYRDNYACCADIDVNIDLAEEIENETQKEKLVLSCLLDTSVTRFLADTFERLNHVCCSLSNVSARTLVTDWVLCMYNVTHVVVALTRFRPRDSWISALVRK